MKGKCPFGKIKCEECVLYRKGLRYYDIPDVGGEEKKPIPFEECAINIGIDCFENLMIRSIGQQKAIEEVRNSIVNLNNFFSQVLQLKLTEHIGDQ